jgi:membrane protein DedA with SNARE-associated domain
MSRMSLPKFILLSTINSTLVTGFWIATGVFLGKNWEDVWEMVDKKPLILLGLLILAGIVLFYATRRHRLLRNQQTPPPESDQAAADSDPG